jgi:hypothetical protein
MSISKLPAEVKEFLRATPDARVVLLNLVNRSENGAEISFFEAERGIERRQSDHGQGVIGVLLRHRLVEARFFVRGGRVAITPLGREALAALTDGELPP